MTLLVRPGSTADLPYLVPRLRAADRAEIRAAAGLPAGLALPQAIAASEPCYAITDEADNPIAIGGITPTAELEGVGFAWLVGTDEITRRNREFLRLSLEWMPKLHERYHLLHSLVDARNTVHIRWLKWLGFSFLRRIERWGAESRPFYEIARHQCASPSLPPSRPLRPSA